MFLIIGELLNSTRGEVKEALEEKDEQHVRELARSQYAAGAEFLDINASESRENEISDTEWLIDVIQDEISDVCFSLDSANPEAIKAGLDRCENEPMINSITNEEDNQPIRELAAESEGKVIGLAMGEEGMPKTVEDRLKETEALLEKCEKLGIDRERLYIDVLAMSVGSSPKQGRYTLDTIREVKDRWGLKTSLGLSNVSFGLPSRALLNSTFLTLLLEAGLDAALIDPTERSMIDAIRATEALLGRDDHCLQYLKYMRER